MIKIGENPAGQKDINKFIAKSGDGLRGKVLAIKENKKEAIILAMNTSIAGDVVWGKLYLIKELGETQYPVVVKEVNNIPNNKKWRCVLNEVI